MLIHVYESDLPQKSIPLSAAYANFAAERLPVFIEQTVELRGPEDFERAMGPFQLRDGRFLGDFLKAFEDARLIAWGRPGSTGAQYIRVPRTAWRYLTIDRADILRNRLDGRVEWYDVHVAVNDDVVDLRRLEQDLRRRKLGKARTGDPGRPTSRHLYLAEYDRRAAAGTLEPTRAAQAELLINWFKATHPDMPLPALKSVKNNITKRRPKL